jgi:CheY-like chemotaxis protein
MRESTVLIVEDDDAIREIIHQSLEFEGYQTLLASNGSEALNILCEGKKVCLILLDMMMPLMNGWEFLKEYQNKESIRHIPVIILTAFNIEKKDLPVVAILKKPIDLENLCQQVEQYCK